MCVGCHNKQQRQPPDAAAAATPAPPPLFEREAATHSHLSVERRWAIILLHKLKRDDAAIATSRPRYPVVCALSVASLVM
jgi:hypothetical protein